MNDTGAKWRWDLAAYLNRSRRFCWANLVTWALGWHKGRGALRETMTGSRCAAESLTHRDRSCYCGKFCAGSKRQAVTSDAE